MSPSASRVRSVWASIFSVTPRTQRRISPQRIVPFERATSTSTPQRLVTWSSSTRLGQLGSNTPPERFPRGTPPTSILSFTPVPYIKVRTGDRERFNAESCWLWNEAKFGRRNETVRWEHVMTDLERNKQVVVDYYTTAFGGNQKAIAD